MSRNHHPYTVTSVDPTPKDAARVLSNMARDAGNDAHSGIGAGSWLIQRSWEAKVFAMAANALVEPVSKLTALDWPTVATHAATLDELGYGYRITSGVDVSDEFYEGVGWSIEVLDGPDADGAK